MGREGQKKRGEGKGGKKQAMDRSVLLRDDHGNVVRETADHGGVFIVVALRGKGSEKEDYLLACLSSIV